MFAPGQMDEVKFYPSAWLLNAIPRRAGSDGDRQRPYRSMWPIANMLNQALALIKPELPGGGNITQRDGEAENDSLHEPAKKMPLTSMAWICLMIWEQELLHPWYKTYWIFGAFNETFSSRTWQWHGVQCFRCYEAFLQSRPWVSSMLACLLDCKFIFKN